MVSKLLVIFVLALSSISFSKTLYAQSFPTQMYTVENLFNDQFSTLRTYISNLKLDYPYKTYKNKIVFYTGAASDRVVIFKMTVKRVIKEDYIKETIIFDSHSFDKERFTFKRWGNNKPLTLEQLTSFKFHYPKNVSAFSIEFRRLFIYQHVDINQFSVESSYRLYESALEIHHNEILNESNLFSKLWYQCDVCSGEPLIAIMDTRTDYLGNMSFYYGNPLKFSTPKEFYGKANRSYLSGIYRAFKSIPLKAFMQFGWPYPN